jgi:N4-gp56 family major capsid protein
MADMKGGFNGGSANPASLGSYFQPVLNKQLIERISDTLKLNELAQQVDLPKNLGAKSVKFFQFDVVPDATKVQTLSEGVAPSSSTYRELGLNTVSVELTQYGEILTVSDLLSATSLLDVLKEGVKVLGQDAAQKADNLSRDAIVTGTDIQATGAAKRYANPNGSVTSFATLKSATVANSYISSTDLLDAVTQLKANKANPYNGKFTAIVPPQVSRDMFRDTDFLNNIWYGGEKGVGSIVKGEIGTFYGVRIVEASNPFIESSSATSEGTFDGAGNIFSTLVLGENAFGVVKLAGDSPMSPKVTVLTAPDKSDILNQSIKAGYKCYYAAKLLNGKRAVVVKSKSRFVAS